MKYDTDVKISVCSLGERLGQLLGIHYPSQAIDFLVSGVTEHNPYYSTTEILNWLKAIRAANEIMIERTPLTSLRQWRYDPNHGYFCHGTGKFFRISGLRVDTNLGEVPSWDQPIIVQPEVGLLGIITKKIDGILYLLLQAKAEPGNIDTFQLAPTVQATRSNFQRVHGGRKVRYLEYFLSDEKKISVLVDQLQSEQGARFYKKRNRNIVIRVDGDQLTSVGKNYRWVTIRQLVLLMQHSNVVNMDTRSVMASIDYGAISRKNFVDIDKEAIQRCLEGSSLVKPPISSLGIDLMISAQHGNNGIHSNEEILFQLSNQKFNCKLWSELISIDEMRGWRRTNWEISHCNEKFFSVIGIRISNADREIESWDQPIIQQRNPGITGFLVQRINGLLHILVQLKMECGNMDLLEMAPTVQCITDSYADGIEPHYLTEFVSPKQSRIVSEVMQSEEGGRFFRETNTNIISEVHENFVVEVPKQFIWLTLGQLKTFIKYNNYLNIQARSLLASVSLL